MAGRILNRRELRKQTDQAEQIEGESPETAVEKPKVKKVRAKAATTGVKKPRAKKAPPRLRARWGVFDGAMKQVAIFDFNQRAEAEEKLAALLARNKGAHFLQIVKEAMVDPAPVEAAAVLPNGDAVASPV